ncbi:nucleophile aminohydrolase [Mycena crocata]|nr:nucleophile aminohydrolase [Mycena crocata]
MNHFPLNWGRPRNDAVDLYGTFPITQRPNHHPKDAFSAGIQHTQQPIVTGTSVLAIKYKDGIMMAADNLGALVRLTRALPRHPAVTPGGSHGDWRWRRHERLPIHPEHPHELMIDEFAAQDGHAIGPAEVHNYLSELMCARRSKMNPLWNALLVGGFKDGQRFLAFVDLVGTTYSASTLATGYGAHIAQPLLRQQVEGREDTLTEEEARKIIQESMKVLFYRDARSLDKYQIATITAAGVHISDSMKLETSWSFAEGIRGYGAQTQ